MLYYFSPKVPLLPFGNTSTFDQKYLYFSLKIPLLFRGSRGISESKCNYFLKVSELHPVRSAVISRAKWRYFRSRLKAIALGVSSAWVCLNLHSRVVVLEIHPSPQVRSARGGLMGLSDFTYKVNTIASILVAIVAVEHLYILWIEMFAWTTKGRKVFKGALPDELFDKTRGLAANQGLYNGFLSAGLFWGLLVSDPIWSFRIQLFFLLCVLTAAIFGAIRSSFSILLKQGLPAALALLFLLLSAL